MTRNADRPGDPADTPRTILFLQGLASPFFHRLGRALAERGHRVLRLNLSLGDRIFWGMGGTDYRGTLAGWRNYLRGFLAEQGVTDLVLFGDCRPYHRIAISLARHAGIAIHVAEEGYFRPFWVTVERGGVNGHSSLPRDPARIRAIADGLPTREHEFVQGSFPRRAAWDVVYNLSNMAGRPFYPGFRRHRPHHVMVEYAGWIRRALRKRQVERHAKRFVDRAVNLQGGFYLVPLQLDSDYQIRVHSRFETLEDFLNEVMASFADHAPPEAELVVKVHPLDSGLIDRRKQIAAIATRHGIAGRVVGIEAGHLPTLLTTTRGVVVVNSTVGTTALEVGRPTIALGTAIYDIPGLTFQNGIDRYWREAQPPDPELFDAFRRLVMARTQINGGFFCEEGLGKAVDGAVDRILASEPARPRFRFDRAARVGPPMAGPPMALRARPAE